MKLKLDESLPAELMDLLLAHHHDVHTVPTESLTGCDDPTVFDAACREDRLLMTQDLDFSDIRKFKPGTHPGVVLIRLHNPGRRKIIERVRQLLLTESSDSWSGCFVVVGDRRLRVRRP